MTSNLTGIGPSLPPGNRTFPVPPSRAASQTFQQTPRSWPRQIYTQAIGPITSRDASEPAFKRQKLEDAGKNSEGVASGDIAGPSPQQAPSIRGGGFAAYKPDSSHNETNSHVHQSPLFPLRPGKDSQAGGVPKSRPLAFERAARRDAVPVKPYVPEPPSIAPRFHKAGKHTTPLKSSRTC